MSSEIFLLHTAVYDLNVRWEEIRHIEQYGNITVHKCEHTYMYVCVCVCVRFYIEPLR